MRLALGIAVALVATPALAAPATPPPSEHHLTLTDSDLQVIRWFILSYGGEHCAPSPDTSLPFCNGALMGRDLLVKIGNELAAEQAAPPPPAPTKGK